MKRSTIFGLCLTIAVGVPVGMLMSDQVFAFIGDGPETAHHAAGKSAVGLTPLERSADQGKLTFASYAAGHRADDGSFEDGKPDIFVPIKQPTFGQGEYDDEAIFGPNPIDRGGIIGSQDFISQPGFVQSGGSYGGGWWSGGGGYYGGGGGGGGGGYFVPPGTPGTPGTPGGVPEPATWAMMLGGFFALGYSIRKRKFA